MTDDTRYHGLLGIAETMEKRALLEGWENLQNAHPIATTASYFIPGVGVVPSAMSAINDFSKGRILSGLGNTGMGLLSLVGLGGGAKLLGLGGKAALRGGQALGAMRTSAGVRLAQQAARVSKAKGAWGTARAIKNPYSRAFFTGIAPLRQGMAYAGTPFRAIGNYTRSGMQHIAAPIAQRMSAGQVGAARATAHALRNPYIRRGANVLAPLGLASLFTGSDGEGTNMPIDGYSSGPNSRQFTPRSPAASSNMRGPAEFGNGSFFQPQLPPSPYRGLQYMNPNANRNTLPFSGTPTPPGLYR